MARCHPVARKPPSNEYQRTSSGPPPSLSPSITTPAIPPSTATGSAFSRRLRPVWSRKSAPSAAHAKIAVAASATFAATNSATFACLCNCAMISAPPGHSLSTLTNAAGSRPCVASALCLLHRAFQASSSNSRGSSRSATSIQSPRPNCVSSQPRDRSHQRALIICFASERRAISSSNFSFSSSASSIASSRLLIRWFSACTWRLICWSSGSWLSSCDCVASSSWYRS